MTDHHKSNRHRKVPAARLSRLAAFGQLAGGLASGAIAEGARRLARGEKPQLSDLLLTPSNAMRVTEQLSRLRGAAMKLGQMLSLDAGDVLPAELTAILARLRDAAHFMPPAQLNRVLGEHWGPQWRDLFSSFDATPVAAASIGQVHKARLKDGRLVAVKVQYPGIAASIDADVDNVAALLRMSGLLPAGLDIKPLLAEAKLQLHEEADYNREAAQMQRYYTLLAQDQAFIVPQPVLELTGQRVLVMDYITAKPIETLSAAPQEQRDKAVAALLDLVLRELFIFGFMQTDPNFANYRWQPETGRIVLLDFGAARSVPQDTVEAYRSLVMAGLLGEHGPLRAALLDVGFITPLVEHRHRAALDGMIDTILAHVNRPGLFNFAERDFVAHLREQAVPIVADRANWHVPPAQTLFIQRKISGTAMLAVRMKARLPLRPMLAAFLEQAQKHQRA
jgi:predicted unusual protein kinase regulating ubiquinone biosynthesis (AarF/ABC1/UbiB family)